MADNKKTIVKMLKKIEIEVPKNASAEAIRKIFIKNREELESNYGKKTLKNAHLALTEIIDEEKEEKDDEYESL